MFPLDSRFADGVRFFDQLRQDATEDDHGTDFTILVPRLAGVLVETAFLFEDADHSLYALLDDLSRAVKANPTGGVLPTGTLPAAHIIDRESEQGRAKTRTFFEEWSGGADDAHQMFVALFGHLILRWESFGVDRRLSLRLLSEAAQRCMGYEISAQELCDVVLENKLLTAQWDVTECIAALSAIAGRRLASLYMNEQGHLDQLVYVMTAEAVRLGVPAGSDWRFGLPANDVPVSAPIDLVMAIEPYVRSFFATICMFDRYEQAVSCAKAAGRMVAVAAGGDTPELEAVIAKPLALSAMSDTYKYVSQYGVEQISL